MPIPGTSPPGLPDWAPTLTQVATYVPHRTLVRSDQSTLESDDTYRFTFDTTTIPLASQVSQLIADGCAWVTAVVTPLNVKSQPLAALVAALWAAIAAERGFPNDDQSLQRANDMEKQMDSMLAALKAANANQNSADGIASTPPAILPQWSFPCPDRRWDYAGYW